MTTLPPFPPLPQHLFPSTLPAGKSSHQGPFCKPWIMQHSLNKLRVTKCHCWGGVDGQKQNCTKARSDGDIVRREGNPQEPIIENITKAHGPGNPFVSGLVVSSFFLCTSVSISREKQASFYFHLSLFLPQLLFLHTLVLLCHYFSPHFLMTLQFLYPNPSGHSFYEARYPLPQNFRKESDWLIWAKCPPLDLSMVCRT